MKNPNRGAATEGRPYKYSRGAGDHYIICKYSRGAGDHYIICKYSRGAGDHYIICRVALRGHPTVVRKASMDHDADTKAQIVLTRARYEEG